MKALHTVWLVTAVALVARAGQVTTWSDSFTGSNGTIVAPGAQWGYTNTGVEVAGYVTVPRLDAQDQHYITNNALFCYVGPVTNDPLAYNKVQAVITPLSEGTPVSLAVLDGTIVAQLDLVDMVQNAGHIWNLGQEMKLSLTPQPAYDDPNNVTNCYFVNMGIRPTVSAPGTSSYIRLQYNTSTMGVINRYTLFNMPSLPPPFVPKTVRFEYSANDMIALYTNGVQVYTSNAPVTSAALSNVYVQFWHGMFNGAGPESSTGDVVIDNVSFEWVKRIGWCNLQWPYALSVANTNGTVFTDKVYGQVWIPGVTEAAGAASGLYAWLGFGPSNDAPTAASWTWCPADFNVNVDNNDEFYTNITVAASVLPGSYGYAWRYKYIAGPDWYGLSNGIHTAANFNPAQCGVLTVIPEPAVLLAWLGAGLLACRRR